jgi:hydroxymethylglutaryl-CoA synthase
LVGIASFGVHLPAYRLAREVIAKATGGRSMGGEKAVANYDEDALTMGVDASLDCIDNYMRAWNTSLDGTKLQALLFCSTSSPYREKQAVSILSSVLEADRSALVMDLNGSLRGGLTGFEVGSSVLKESGIETKILIVAADRRNAAPGSPEEQAFGDGAAAFLLGQGDVLFTVEERFAINANFPHFWRRENDAYVQAGDTRFVENLGYLPLMREAIDGLLKKANITSSNVAKLIVYAPNPRLAIRLAHRLGFNPETQLADTLFDKIGDTGTAQVFLSLISVLAEAQPGEKIVIAGYGDGAEAVLLRISEHIHRVDKCRGLGAHLGQKIPLNSYAKYLHFRGVTGDSSYDAFSSLPLLWREENQNLRIYAAKCQKCGMIHFPCRRICHKCGAKDQMDALKLKRKGEIYTYTNDYLYTNPDPPQSLAVVDLEGGGRFFGQVTDVERQEMRIGLEVELSFRKIHDGQGLPNYFWKIKPVTARE